MADVTLDRFSHTDFIGDTNGIVDASDIPAAPDEPSRPGLEFPDGSDESAAVSAARPVPSQYDGSNNLAVDIYYYGDAVGGGNTVDWEVCFEAITESDAHDLHASADYFAAVQSVTDTVDATAGELNVARIVFSNAQADGVQPGDLYRLCVRRDSDDASNDTYADSVWLAAVELIDVQ